MSRLHCEVSVGFLEEGISGLSPEGHKGDLGFESCAGPSAILGREVGEISRDLSGWAHAPTQEHEPGIGGPGRSWCYGM